MDEIAAKIAGIYAPRHVKFWFDEPPLDTQPAKHFCVKGLGTCTTVLPWPL